jgi:hypothetical protein
MSALERPKEEPVFAPLCIWCSFPWSKENVKVFVKAGSQASTYGYRSSIDVKVQIKCHNCKKVMYQIDAKDCSSGIGPEISTSEGRLT